MKKLSQLSIALALSLALPGCAAKEIPIPLTEEGALKAFKPIANSSAAPCPLQREVAKHNAAYDTLKTGKPASYSAPCDVDKKPAPKVALNDKRTS
jgi:hypothetical protein